ncbi:MAG: LTA synthase family protein [Candidatus Binatia bacterium]
MVIVGTLRLFLFAVFAVVCLHASLHRHDLPPEAESQLLPLLANGFLWAGYGAFWLLLIPRPRVALPIAFASVGALALVNLRKVSELAEPIMLFDLFQLRNAPLLIEYLPPGDWVLLGAGLVAVAAAAWRRGTSQPRRASMVAALLALVVFATLLGRSFAADGDSWAKRVFRTADVFWEPLAHHRSNGFLVASLLDVPQLSVAVPRRYEAGRGRELLEPYLACDAVDPGAARPHVVVTMLESFWDPTLEGLAFDRDPLPSYRALRDRGAVQQFVSPVFGSRTANAEFEVLTGLSTRFSPIGSVPYQQYVKRPIVSVASVFREAGYRTVAVHNFLRRFWNRDAVYPNLGFDEYVGLEDMGDVPWELGWPSDAALFDRVEKIIAEAEQPTFVFAVTVATHGPYTDRGWEPTIQLIGDSRPDLAAPMSGYATKLELLDHHFGDFVGRLDALPEPPILVAFADHLPTIAASALPPDRGLGVPRLRLVEALILGAREALPEVATRSLNCLGPEILRLAGVPAPPFFRFVEELCSRLPIVTPAAALEEADGILEAYRWLSYDRLFGEGYSSGSCGPV